MNNLHLQGAAITGAQLVGVICTHSFQSYVKSKRPNRDGCHADIIRGCTATNETNQDMLDSLFGFEKLSDLLELGGRLILPSN